MVTAVLIPLIFLYFFVVAVKERKKRYEEWLQINSIREVAFLEGEIKQIYSRVENYVGKNKIYIVQLLIKGKHSSVKAFSKTPITTDNLPSHEFIEGQQILCYGYWEQESFVFSRYEIKKLNKEQ